MQLIRANVHGCCYPYSSASGSYFMFLFAYRFIAVMMPMWMLINCVFDAGIFFITILGIAQERKFENSGIFFPLFFRLICIVAVKLQLTLFHHRNHILHPLSYRLHRRHLASAYRNIGTLVFFL